MLVVFKYLEFKYPEVEKEYELSKQEELSSSVIQQRKAKKDWFDKNIRFFKQKLSHIDDSTTFITPKYAFFCEHFEKIKYQDDKVVGRL